MKLDIRGKLLQVDMTTGQSKKSEWKKYDVLIEEESGKKLLATFFNSCNIFLFLWLRLPYIRAEKTITISIISFDKSSSKVESSLLFIMIISTPKCSQIVNINSEPNLNNLSL